MAVVWSGHRCTSSPVPRSHHFDLEMNHVVGMTTTHHMMSQSIMWCHTVSCHVMNEVDYWQWKGMLRYCQAIAKKKDMGFSCMIFHLWHNFFGKFTLVQFFIRQSDHYKVLHMPWQHSCHVMCKMLLRSLHQTSDDVAEEKLNSNFNYNGKIIDEMDQWSMHQLVCSCRLHGW